MQVSTTATTAAIALAMSVAFYWHFHRQAENKPRDPSTGTLPKKPEEAPPEPKEQRDSIKPVRIKSLYSSSQLQKDYENQLQQGNSSGKEDIKSSATSEPPPKPQQPQKQQQGDDDDMEAFKKKKITINDVPDFTIELDDSDNDMF